ncbi:M23 family metallopeptidase [Streptomyces apocyni]|uniref:M23 family metallopeptidase n=1 Tax=Streptomyces apocyni TaxID=2654677 RepID=UPI0012EAB7E9|nr:M23 family metallopeptidase [Streptomyces apocyni]
MNDQHGYAAGYGDNATGAFDATFASDPLFGTMPGAATPSDPYHAYDSGQSGQWDSTAWSTGSYDTLGTTGVGAHATVTYDPYAAQSTTPYETGSYDTTAVWANAGYQQLSDIPAQPGPQATEQWDGTGQWQAGSYGQHPQTYDSGAYDATAWNSDGATTTAYGTYDAYGTLTTPTYEQPSTGADFPEAEFPEAEFSEPDVIGTTEPDDGANGYESTGYAYDGGHDGDVGYDDHDAYATEDDDHGSLAADVTPAPAPAAYTPDTARPRNRDRGGNRTRRRAPAKRSGLLTVAVPSVCALGVAGIAAASVNTGLGDSKGDTKTQAAPDPATPTVKPAQVNRQLDTQLANLSAEADNFAGRASRTQERIDLKERQEAERKRKIEEAERKERLRPKFAAPVAPKGLSARFGQAGINWMSVHTGIDFPVSYGTPVMAATDGTVRTQWNSAYGNMAIVTAPDGTETWYCHLSSTKIRSGTVKAGDVIAYAGNSGNSTGPHLHFEVRPGGGAAIDPLAWFLSHGINPA